jgi:hypothetical protein
MADVERDRADVSTSFVFRVTTGPVFLLREGAGAGAGGGAGGGPSFAALTLAEGLDCLFGKSVVLAFAGPCIEDNVNIERRWALSSRGTFFLAGAFAFGFSPVLGSGGGGIVAASVTLGEGADADKSSASSDSEACRSFMAGREDPSPTKLRSSSSTSIAEGLVEAFFLPGCAARPFPFFLFDAREGAREGMDELAGEMGGGEPGRSSSWLSSHSSVSSGSLVVCRRGVLAGSAR